MIHEILDEQRQMDQLRRRVDATVEQLASAATFDAARRLIEQVREEVLDEFPDKAEVFDLVLLPRFRRVMDERRDVLDLE